MEGSKTQIMPPFPPKNPEEERKKVNNLVFMRSHYTAVEHSNRVNDADAHIYSM
jgi:hypothetical protein